MRSQYIIYSLTFFVNFPIVCRIKAFNLLNLYLSQKVLHNILSSEMQYTQGNIEFYMVPLEQCSQTQRPLAACNVFTSDPC